MEELRLLHRGVGSLRAAPEGERDHPREPAHLLFRQLVLGMVRQAGVVHGLDLGWSCKNSATARAFSSCWRMRTASVLRPRSTIQESKAPGTAPAAFW